MNLILRVLLAISAGTFGAAGTAASGVDVASLSQDQWVSAIITGLAAASLLFKKPEGGVVEKVKDALKRAPAEEPEPEIEYPTTSPCHQDCGCPSI